LPLAQFSAFWDTAQQQAAPLFLLRGASMEFSWVKGQGFRFSVHPRFALCVFAAILAFKSPDYLPQVISILRAGLVG
jgi:hypothetical protein